MNALGHNPRRVCRSAVAPAVGGVRTGSRSPVRRCRTRPVDNVDRLRFPNGPDELPGQASERLAELLSYSDRLQILFDRLDEPGDRELLIRVLAYRVLGHRKVSLPMSARRLDELIARAWTARTASNTLPLGINGWHADDYDLTIRSVYPLRLRVSSGLLCTHSNSSSTAARVLRWLSGPATL